MEKVNQSLLKPKSTSCFRNASIASFLKDRSLHPHTISQNRFVGDKLEKARTLYQKNLSGHYGCVNALDFSQDGQYLITGGDDRRVLLWSVNNSILGSSSLAPHVMEGRHNSNIFSLAFSANNSKIFSAGNDEMIAIHDVNTGRTLDSFMHEAVVYCVAVHPEQDSVFATAREDGKLLLYDTRESCNFKNKKHRVTSSYYAYHSIQFHPLQPTLMLSANYREGVALWDVRSSLSPVMRYGGRRHRVSAMSATFSRNGSRVLALRRRQCPVVYNVDNTRPVLEADAPYYYNSCTMKSGCFAGDRNQYILSGSDDFSLYMWRIPDETSPSTPRHLSRPMVTLRGHRSIVNQVRSSCLGLIASSGVGKTVKVWSSLPLPGGCGTGERFITRKVYSHTQYLQLIMQGLQETHDYSDGNTEEDPRMMAFFDSLVQREVNNSAHLTYDSETQSSTETGSSDDESDSIMTPSSVVVGLTEKFVPALVDLTGDAADPSNANECSRKSSAQDNAKQCVSVNASSTSGASTSVILEGRDVTPATFAALPPVSIGHTLHSSPGFLSNFVKFPSSNVSVTPSSASFTPDLSLLSTSSASNSSSLIGTLSAANSSVPTASTSSSSHPLTCMERFAILEKLERLSWNRRLERREIQERRNQLHRRWQRRFDSYLTLSEVLQLCAAVGIDVDHMLDVHRQADEAEALSPESEYGADEGHDDGDDVEVPAPSAEEDEARANVRRERQESGEEDVGRVGLRGIVNRPTGDSDTSGSDSDTSDSSLHLEPRGGKTSKSVRRSDSEELSDNNIDADDDDDNDDDDDDNDDDDDYDVRISSDMGRDNKSGSNRERTRLLHSKRIIRRHKGSNVSDNLQISGGGLSCPVSSSSNVSFRNSGDGRNYSSEGVSPSVVEVSHETATDSGVGADTKLAKEGTEAAFSSSVTSSERVSMRVRSEGTHGHSEASASEECGAIAGQERRESASASSARTSAPPSVSSACCIGHPARGSETSRSETSSSGACDSRDTAAGSVQRDAVTIPSTISGSSCSNSDQGVCDLVTSHNDGDVLTDHNYTHTGSSQLTSSSSSTTAAAGSSGSNGNAASSSGVATSRSVNRASTSPTENVAFGYAMHDSQHPVALPYSTNQPMVPTSLSTIIAFRSNAATASRTPTMPYRSILQLITARRAQQQQRRNNRRLDRRLRRRASRKARHVMRRDSVRYRRNKKLFARSQERRERRMVLQELLPHRAGLPSSGNVSSQLLDSLGPPFSSRGAMRSSRPLLAPYTLVENSEDSDTSSDSDTSNIDDTEDDEDCNVNSDRMRSVLTEGQSTGGVGDTFARRGNTTAVVVGKRKRGDFEDGDQAGLSQSRRSMSRTDTSNEGSGGQGSAAATPSRAALGTGGEHEVRVDESRTDGDGTTVVQFLAMHAGNVPLAPVEEEQLNDSTPDEDY